MTEFLAAIILGVVQGLTEFLPVSSSGHLVLFQQWLPVVGDHIAFDLALHIGTLLPVVLFYRADLRRMVVAPFAEEGPMLQRPGVRLALLVILGSVPTAAIGLAFEDVFEAMFGNLLGVGVAFGVTGCALFATRFVGSGSTDERQMAWWQALAIGTVQGLAITPGISRSGSTIAIALFLGMKREYAARYSFLLSIPAIGGGFLLKAKDLQLDGAALGPLAVGFIAAALSGYGALLLLVRLVKKGDFSRFSYYLWPLAVLSIGLALGGLGADGAHSPAVDDAAVVP